MKQPLVPTPRTDKNGRTQIRHLRPERGGSSGARIPAPPLPPETPSRIDDLIGLVHDLLTAADDTMADPAWVPYARPTLEAAEQEDPELLPLATRLLTTGSAPARLAAAEVLRGTIVQVGRDARRRDRSRAEGTQSPQLLAEDFLGTDLHNEMAIAWTAGAVSDEFGEGASLNDAGMLRMTSDLRWATRKLRKAMALTNDLSGAEWNGYWRGLAALQRSGIGIFESVDDPTNAPHAIEFVGLAGKHPDIPALVRSLRERRIQSVQEAVTLLRELGEHPQPLSDGAL